MCVDAHYLCFRQEIWVFGNIVSKNENFHIKLKFGADNNVDIQNSIGMLTFFVLVQEYHIWENLLSKIKIVT